MTTEELEKLITAHRPLSTRYYDQKSYKIGVNAGIFQETPKLAPDNRIPVPFIWRAIKLMKGFFATVGKITYSDETKWFETNLAPIYDTNNEELQTAAQFESGLAYSRGFELHWYDGDFRFAKVPIDQCIPVYSDDLVPEMTSFVWYRLSGDDALATEYTATDYTEYRKPKNEGNWVQGETKIHLYQRVPIVEFIIDSEKRNAVDQVLPLVDFYDKMISEVGNEHEKFANSILLLRNTLDAVTQDENGLTDADKVAMWRVLDRLGENVKDSAAYLERNVKTEFISMTLDIIDRKISEFLMLPGEHEDKMTAQSAKAMLIRFHYLELLMADYEAYFSIGLQDRIKLIAGHKLSGMSADGTNGVTIKFARNYPMDLEALVDFATKLTGILSRETLLKQFPSTIVDDVTKEMARIENEAPQLQMPPSGNVPPVMDNAKP